MAIHFDLAEYLRRADGVAAAVSATDVFGLMRRTYDLPAQWAALVTRKAGNREFVAPGAAIDGNDADEVLFVRTSPVDVRMSFADIVSKDHFQFQVDVQLRVHAIADQSELQSFRDAVMGSYRIATAANLERFFAPIVRTALEATAARSAAGELATGGGLQDAVGAIGEAVDGPCFSAGLAMTAPPVVELHSEVWDDVRAAKERAAARKYEHDALQQVRTAQREAQRRHLDHVTGLLAELRTLAESSPDADLPELVRTFPEHQRGELYQALFDTAASDGARTAWIVVSAGGELLFFRPDRTGSPDRRIPIEGAAGPVRSLQVLGDASNAPVLLLGAATGVYRLPLDSASPDLTLQVPNAPNVRGGFNAAVAVGNHIVATHSELGIMQWDAANPSTAKPLFEEMTRTAKAIRGVLPFDGQLYCSIGDRVISWPAGGVVERPIRTFSGALCTISSLQATTDGLFAGTSDGDVLYWSNGSTKRPERIHTGQNRAAESVWVTDSFGVRRVVYTDTSLCVHAKVIGDSFAARYEAGGQTLRRVEVAPDILVATNDLRDRLICWSTGAPKRPNATIAVSQICQQSIQDVCLLPA